MQLRRFILGTWVAPALAASVCAGPAISVAYGLPASGTVPTFNRDAAPILFGHCVDCHRAGEIGAGVSLVSYADAKPWAQAIKRAVRSGTLPPWPADPARSVKFRNDRRLRPEDIDILAA